MSDANTGVMRLFSEIVHAIRFHGPEKTSDILYESRAAELHLYDKDVGKVLTIVSSNVNIPVSEIISGKGRKNNRRFAIGLTAWYLKHEFNFSPPDISRHLNRERTAVWKYFREIEKLNPQKNSDKDMCEIKAKCDREITAYKKSKIAL